jgi:hypothetical protein
VVHQVGDARDRTRRDGQRLDELRLGLRRRRQALAVVDVVREPDGDASLARSDQRVRDDLGGRRLEAQVVQCDVERPLRGAEEIGDRARDLVGGLAAVAQRPDVDQLCFARWAALYAFFAAW